MKSFDEKLFESEQEWRRALWSKVEKIEEKVSDLRVKIALISGSVSLLTTLIVLYLNK